MPYTLRRFSNHPSLNQCLHYGPNVIELIPDILLQFREIKFGVVADTMKAFLQIGARNEIHDFSSHVIEQSSRKEYWNILT